MRRMLVVLVALGGFISRAAGQIYQDTSGNPYSNFIPLGPDGTPGRPAPGDHIGNQITVAGTSRLLDDVQLWFGLNTNYGVNPNPATDTYTVDLYNNNGPGGAPGTLFASSSMVGGNPGAATLSLIFPFEVMVPNSFTVVVSSTHPTNTAGTLAGVVGPYNAGGNPTIGSGVDTVWYNTNSSATTWVSNSTWAKNDGAVSNLFTMILDASSTAPYNTGGAFTTNSANSNRVAVANNTTVTFNTGANISAYPPSHGIFLRSAVFSSVAAFDGSQIIDNGGNFTGACGGGTVAGLTAYDHSNVSILSGSLAGNISSGGFVTNVAAGLTAMGSSAVKVSGGSFAGFISSGGGATDTAAGLLAEGNATVSILGGSFSGTGNTGGGSTEIHAGVDAAGLSKVYILGGSFTSDFGPGLWAQDSAQVLLVGRNFNFPYGGISALTGTITGTLYDGQSISLKFQQAHPDQITLSAVPEPSSLEMLALAAGIGGLSLRRGRHRRPRAAN